MQDKSHNNDVFGLSEFYEQEAAETKEFDARIDAKRGLEGCTGEECPNCQRVRVELGQDGKRRCWKCAWCIEENGYDYELFQFLHHVR